MNWLVSNVAFVTGNWWALVVLGFGTYRLSYLLVKEDGPFKLAVGLRWLTGVGTLPDGRPIVHNSITPLYCIRCTSVWVAAILLVLPLWVGAIFAISCLAIIVASKDI